MKYVKNEDGSVTSSGDDTFVGNMIDGLTAPFMGANDLIGQVPARWATAIYASAGVVGGGYFARKRAEAGKEAIAGFLL
jgi:hypothetical protein